MLFATMHNAAATEEDGFGSFVANHKKSLEGALEAGFRGINLDIGKCDDGKLALVHGRCAFGSRDPIETFSNIVNFLKANPKEVLIMPTQIENGAGGGEVLMEEISKTFLKVPGLMQLLYEHPGPSTSWPTLQELIDRDRRILFFHYNGVEDCSDPKVTCHPAFHKYFDYTTETRYEFDTTEALKDTRSSCEITRGIDGEKDFFGVNDFTMDRELCQFNNAKKFLAQHISDCAGINSKQPNLLLVDCWDKGDVIQVVQDHNAILVPTTAVAADVDLEFRGLTSIIVESNLPGMLDTCSRIFGDNLDPTLFKEVHCDLMTQEIAEPYGEQVIRLLIRVRALSSQPDKALERKALEDIVYSASLDFRDALYQVDPYFTSIKSIYLVGSNPPPTQSPSGGTPTLNLPGTSDVNVTIAPVETLAPTPKQTQGAILLTPP